MNKRNSGSHPVLDTMRNPFETLQTRKALNQLILWANSGITGAVVLGEGRTGKSSSITLNKDKIYIQNNSQPLPNIRYRAKKKDQRTIAQCYRNLFSLTGERPKRGYTTDDMGGQILNYMLDLSALHPSRQIILFVDEFQRLTPDQLTVFAEFQDDLLEDHDVLLNIYLFGNLDESEELLLKVDTRQYDYLFGRFFTQRYFFQGITSIRELRQCLRQYDTLRYPTEDGPTYTEYFLPSAFSQGWRLENLSELIWKTYNSVKKPERRSSWGMKYFSQTMVPLLRDYLKKYGPEKANENMILRCIEASDYYKDNIQRDVA